MPAATVMSYPEEEQFDGHRSEDGGGEEKARKILKNKLVM